MTCKMAANIHVFYGSRARDAARSACNPSFFFADRCRLYEAGDDLNGTAAFIATLDIDGEDTLVLLRPSHQNPTLGER